jgi:hypothetical protein
LSNQGPFQIRQFPQQPLPGTNGNYEVGGMFNNPSGTYPFPSPSGMPYSQWQSARTPVNWTNATNSLDAAFVTVGYWQSPLYDLRPEIRGADGSTPSGVPIWSSGGRKLFIQIHGLLSLVDGITATQELKVSSREYGEIFDAKQLERVTPDSDITQDVAAGGDTQQPSVILSFSPNDGHGSYRYWRLELAFKRLDRITHPLSISGAFY